jgi:hypothetical protein
MASSTKRKSTKRKSTAKKKWSQRVTQTSDALTLEPGVFTRKNPRDDARSLSKSAERSHRRKSAPYRSAMSMLTFYLNRAGKHMSAEQRRTLEKAKDALRELYGKQPAKKTAKRKRARRPA